jgi:hypothetical protein
MNEYTRVGEAAFLRVTNRFKFVGFVLLLLFAVYVASVLWLYIEVKSQFVHTDFVGGPYNGYLILISYITAWRAPEFIHRSIDFLGACGPALVLLVPTLACLSLALKRSRLVYVLKAQE